MDLQIFSINVHTLYILTYQPNDMVICYTSSDGFFIKYYPGQEFRTREYLDESRKSEFRTIPAAFDEFILISRKIPIREELDMLIKIWNENPKIVSSELLFRISNLARILNLKLRIKV